MRHKKIIIHILPTNILILTLQLRCIGWIRRLRILYTSFLIMRLWSINSQFAILMLSNGCSFIIIKCTLIIVTHLISHVIMSQMKSISNSWILSYTFTLILFLEVLLSCILTLNLNHLLSKVVTISLLHFVTSIFITI